MPNHPLATLDLHRSTASAIVARACELAELQAPLDGLGVAVGETTERLYAVLAFGSPITAPSFVLTAAWRDAGWDVVTILNLCETIYDHAQQAWASIVDERAAVAS